MRPFFKVEGKFCSLMYSFITIVRCGTISVIPSLLAHAGIDFQRFYGIETFLDGGWSETKHFRCSFAFKNFWYFFR